MAIEITMPKLSDTMTEGLFAAWKKSVGDRIERGDIIAEVETDKSVMDLEAFASGILIKILVQGGETVPVGTVLGLIGEAGESVDAAPVSKPEPETAEIALPVNEPSRPVTAVPPVEAAHAEPGHEKASPLVRRLAREQGVELEQVTGTGPEGRITREDLEAFTGAGRGGAAASPPEPEPRAVVPEAAGTVPQPTPMRQAIAATVTRSWQTIPHFSVNVEINMEACREIVAELKERPVPVGYDALVIKACAVALQEFPLLRAIDPASPDDINISFAVSLPDGLLMPVIRQCQDMSAAGIDIEVSRLADKCRAGRLTTEELTGGSFSVSNLGMYGVEWFTALIMPGQAGILAVGTVRERPVVQDGGRIVAAATMRVTLTSDHRAVDGAYAASFLAKLRSIMEKPVALLM
jgi:pyruvate dehydrogenase E2 component (dihydrolipoamide acetyltransferase)